MEKKMVKIESPMRLMRRMPRRVTPITPAAPITPTREVTMTDYSAEITYLRHAGYGLHLNTPVDSASFTNLEDAKAWVAEVKSNSYCHSPRRIVIEKTTWTDGLGLTDTVMEWSRDGAFGEWRLIK